MEWKLCLSLIILCGFSAVLGHKIRLPSFNKLKLHYPGYKHFGGRFTHRRIKSRIGCNTSDLHHVNHDTSALRLSFALNKVGGPHSIGTSPIHLSKYGKDSVEGRDGLQYLYDPTAYGPYFADKYGYPNVSVLHQTDPIATKKRFWQKQGIMEIMTYTKIGNRPRSHMALWDCDHIHQAKDWIGKHSLITVEFWESPDSNCSKPEIKNSKPVFRRKKGFRSVDKQYRKVNHKSIQKLEEKDRGEPTYVRVARIVIDKPLSQPGVRYDTFLKAAYDRNFEILRPVYTYEKRYLKKPKKNSVVPSR